MSKKVICDICGEEDKIGLDDISYYTRVGYYDLCHDCFKSLIKAVKHNVGTASKIISNQYKFRYADELVFTSTDRNGFEQGNMYTLYSIDGEGLSGKFAENGKWMGFEHFEYPEDIY
jgi:hypothetical protein